MTTLLVNSLSMRGEKKSCNFHMLIKKLCIFFYMSTQGKWGGRIRTCDHRFIGHGLQPIKLSFKDKKIIYFSHTKERITII
jgi:hypothetical protein